MRHKLTITARHVEVWGHGPTPEAALDDAMDNAVEMTGSLDYDIESSEPVAEEDAA